MVPTLEAGTQVELVRVLGTVKVEKAQVLLGTVPNGDHGVDRQLRPLTPPGHPHGQRLGHILQVLLRVFPVLHQVFLTALRVFLQALPDTFLQALVRVSLQALLEAFLRALVRVSLQALLEATPQLLL
jgi:hypothetical protein